MKKIPLILSMFLGISMANADTYDYPYMIFQTSDGNETTMQTESLSFTISDGKLVATNTSGSVTFDLSSLTSMQFSKSGEVTAIDKVSSEKTPVEVFSVAGVSVGKFDCVDDARQSLPSGMYIVKSSDKTYKITVK